MKQTLCMICSKYFAGIDNLFKHMEKAHQTISEHSLDNESANEQNELVDLLVVKKRKSCFEKQLGSNTCPKCGKEFGSRVLRCLKVRIENCKGVPDINETAKNPQQMTPIMPQQCIK